MKVVRKFVDWKATGNKLYRLRSDNVNLRRFVCSAHRHGTDMCNNEGSDCDNCTDKDMDRSISRKELSDVFGVSEDVISNWENGVTEVKVEDLLFYCSITKVKLEDILVFVK